MNATDGVRAELEHAGETFVCTVEHSHRRERRDAPHERCVVRFVAWRRADDDTPLEIEFVDGRSDGHVPARCELPGPPTVQFDNAEYDLSRPEVMSALLTIAMAEGWNPRARRSIVAADGFEWLARHSLS